MPTFFAEVSQLPGKNRTNVFALLVAKLSHYKPKLPEDILLIKSLLLEVKALFHNHEQRFGILDFILRQHLGEYKHISSPLKEFLIEVCATLKDAKFNEYFTKKIDSETDIECNLQRIFESHVATCVLLNPGRSMWAGINRISKTISDILAANKENKSLHLFLRDLGPSSESAEVPYLALSFGRFTHVPSVDEVIAVLKAQDNLTTTMLIHFLFMRDAYPYCAMTSLPPHLKDFKGDFASFLTRSEGMDPRVFFWDFHTHAPHLYTDRGRGEFINKPSKRLGITLHEEERAEFPSITTSWCPDCLSQKVDMRSPYVKRLAESDIPYVAGPSGMTSLFCGAMIFLAHLRSVDEQNLYLLAVMAFITSGGLHSIHEVLTIPHVRLGLLPGYKTTGPQVGNYHDFFMLLGRDATFVSNIRDAWGKTVDWMSRKYPHLMSISTPEPVTPEPHACCTIQ